MATFIFRRLRPGTTCKLLLIACLPYFVSCYGIRRSRGGGQSTRQINRVPKADDILLTPGYKIGVVTQNLTYPTACTFDDSGQLYVVEGGYSYGEAWTRPALIRISENGDLKVIASGGDNGPWTGVDFYQGNFYIAEGGSKRGGKILRINLSGQIDTLLSDLPGGGDHHTNGPVVRNGYIYFGQGAATNSGVVGPDNAHFGWLYRKPGLHDIPCQDIILAGVNFETPNVLDKSAGSISTGAFSPFGKPTQNGQRIPGSIPCTGAIMRIPVNGGKPEVVAWGFRNPFGLRFSHEGNLYVTDNAYDERGSRPVWGAGDLLWQVKTGTWYGFPDFSGDMLLADDAEFKSPGSSPIQSLLKEHPDTPPKPAAILGVHSSSNGFDFATDAFGFPGEAFIAQFGDMAPGVGKVLAPVGFKLVRVDPLSGIIRDFAVNGGKHSGPASALGNGGLERPVSVRFNKTGNQLYVVDFGIVRTDKKGTFPQAKTGVIWRITRTNP